MKGAELNDAECQYRVAWSYEQGIGVQQDPTKAFEWYLKAAHNKHYQATINLARCYENAFGCERNTIKAKIWYLVAEKLKLKEGKGN